MHELKAIQGLASAAAQLCAAHEELAAAGYDRWSREVRALIDIMDAEVDWLRSETLTGRFAVRP